MRVKNINSAVNGEFFSGFPGFDFRFLFPALILLLGISNNCFINWMTIEAEMPLGNFFVFRVVQQKQQQQQQHSNKSSTTTTTQHSLHSSSSSSSSSPLQFPSSPSSNKRQRQVTTSRDSSASKFSGKVTTQNETDVEFPWEILRAANVTFAFEMEEKVLIVRRNSDGGHFTNQENKDNDNSQDTNLSYNNNNNNINNNNNNKHINNTNNNHTNNNYDDGVVHLDTKRAEVKRAAIVLSRSGWMTLEQTVYLSISEEWFLS